jgi:hypothetical protein
MHDGETARTPRGRNDDERLSRDELASRDDISRLVLDATVEICELLVSLSPNQMENVF